ncbi:MAG TPA: response regulator [Polyangiaceae bacterium]|nr:response regulator [Polyangiaceae bacterium]
MADSLRYFRVEAREILEQLQAGLLELEREGVKEASVARLLRLAHTLKGAARVVKQLEIAGLAHRLEDQLVPLRGPPRSITTQEGEQFLVIVDAIARQVRGLSPPPTESASGEPVETKARASTSGKAQADEPVRVGAAPLEHVEGLMDGVTELGFQLATARHALPGLARSRGLAEELAARLDPRRGSELGSGALVTLRALAGELESRLSGVQREVSSSLERATRELGQVRDRVDQLRLVTAATIFGSLERAARDAAVSLGKQAVFEGRGGDVRLDADVLNAVQRALLQGVRNAVAHGIEAGAERTAKGKPAQGRVTVDVQRRGRQISVVCQDDGRGVDLDGVWREAERQGRLAAVPEQPSTDALLELLMRGGLSTSATVSEMAGRGVGLDLIREALASVGGTVVLRTTPGAGTTLELSVPASMSALDVLIVEVGETLHAIPLNAVVQAVRLASRELSRTADSTSLLLEGQVIPFVPLAWLLKAGDVEDAARASWSTVIIRGDSGLLAIGVDRLLGNEGVVVRALPESVEIDPTVSGVTLDADGNPRLLLDPDGLVLAARSTAPRPAQRERRKRSVLIVDDSLTTRMLEQSILESAGYEVGLATSGEEGLERARERSYDLFLVDVEMPGMDGFSFIQQLQADPRLAATPAVLVTSRASAADLARGRAVGAKAHIAKGEFDQLAFLDQIGRLMR